MSSPNDDEIARLRNALASAARSQEALLAGVAHDLRNPLNTFAMSSGLMRDDLERGEVDATRALGLVKRMDRATGRMQQLIEDLLEGSKVTAGKIELDLRREPLAVVVQEAIALARPLATERGVTLAAGDVDGAVASNLDRGRIVQALQKSIAFVLRVTGDGGRITLGARASGPSAVLEVHATNADGTRSTRAMPDEGRGGLALLIARGLVSAHGGELEVTADDGTRAIVITLPKSSS